MNSRPAAPAGCGYDCSPVHSAQGCKAPHWCSTYLGCWRRKGPHIDVREPGLQVGLHPVLEARARGVEGRQADPHPSLPGLDRCHGHSLRRSPCQDGLAVDNRVQSWCLHAVSVPVQSSFCVSGGPRRLVATTPERLSLPPAMLPMKACHLNLEPEGRCTVVGRA